MSQNINETCKKYLEMERTEKYINCEKSIWGRVRVHSGASILQNGVQHDWEKPLHQMIVHKVFFS